MMQHTGGSLHSRIARPLFVALALLFLAAAGLVPPAPAQASCGGTTFVGDEVELAAAIANFNSQNGACNFTIQFENDIELTANLQPIQAQDPGVTLVIDGANFTLDANGNFSVISLVNITDALIENLTIKNSSGAGILARSTILRVERTTLKNNYESGIDFDDGDLTVSQSTIAYNGNGVVVNSWDLMKDGLNVINSTIVGNSFLGIVTTATVAQLTHVTLYQNNNGGLLASYDSEVKVYNSILAGSSGYDCEMVFSTIDIQHSLVQRDYCGTMTGATGNILDEDPLLGQLSDNGGPTFTMPLLVLGGTVNKTSPAINAGSNALATLADGKDQRGEDRPDASDPTVDMGAYEGSLSRSCTSNAAVSNEAQFSAAIICFNQATTGDYTIELLSNIDLTFAPTRIHNASNDVSLLIDGSGKRLDGQGEVRGLVIWETQEVAIDYLIIDGLLRSGIESYSSNLRLTRSTISNSGGYGIYFVHGELTLRDSSILNNSEIGIYLEDYIGTTSLVAVNSTIAGNGTGGLGSFNGAVKLIHVTIADNAYGLFVYGEKSAEVYNSILADNQGMDCVNPLLQGMTIVYSLVENTFNCPLGDPTSITGQDPLLGPLANNGGPTWTHLPGEGSPAIDAGGDALAKDEDGDDLTADQRGFTRFQGSAVDMGSVEVGAAPAAAVYMSATKSGSVSGGPYGPVDYDNSDILMWNGEMWSKWFDGSAAGLFPENKPKHNTNAFWIPDGEGEEVIMSFGQNGRKIPGLTAKVDGTDLVWWDGEQFTFWFDGSDVDLKVKTKEKIDGLHVLPGSAAPDEFGGGCVAWLLISTQGPAKVPAEGGGQLKAGGEDVLGFCATNLGEDTAGFWRLVVDGSAVGLKKNAVDGLSLSEDGQTLYMTMKKAVNSPVVAGHSMIIAYDLDSETFYGPLFKAADYSLTKKIDGMQVQGTLGD